MPTVWSNILQRTLHKWSNSEEPGNHRPLLDQPWFRTALDRLGIENVQRIEHDYNHCQIIIHVKDEPPIQVPNATLYEWHLKYIHPQPEPEPEKPRPKRLVKI